MTSSASLLCMLGSPRRRGNSDLLAVEVVRGFEEAGGKSETVVLTQLDLRDCTGCDWCKQDHERPCVIRDDMQDLYDRMKRASAIVWATPVYYWSPTVALKTVVDRLFAWGDWQTTRHAKALDGCPVGLVVTYAEDEPAESGYYHTFHILKAAVESSGGKLAGCVHASATDKGEVSQQPLALQAARQLGMQLYELGHTGK